MRCDRTAGWSTFAVLVVVTAGLAQDKPPVAAPPAAAAADSVPGTFRAFIVLDDRFPKDNVRNRTAKMHCLVIENGLNPVCAVFARAVPAAADAPVANLIKQLNGVVQKNRASNSASFVTFLSLDKEYPADENRAAKAAEVRGLADQLKTPGVTFGLAPGKAPEAAPEGAPDKPAETNTLANWKIGDKDDIVVVVYHRMRVVQRWAFTADKPPTDEDIKAIVDAFEKEAKNG